jgi:hypothetical protein
VDVKPRFLIEILEDALENIRMVITIAVEEENRVHAGRVGRREVVMDIRS